MKKYRYRVGDIVKPVEGVKCSGAVGSGEPFAVGRVISHGCGQGAAWYQVACGMEVFNCREDEIELVEKAYLSAWRMIKPGPECLLMKGVFEISSLWWHKPIDHPDEGEGIVMMMTENPVYSIQRGVFRDGSYHVWVPGRRGNAVVSTVREEGSLWPIGDEAVLCWSPFEVPEVPDEDEEDDG